jgi:hypothetical protein
MAAITTETASPEGERSVMTTLPPREKRPEVRSAEVTNVRTIGAELPAIRRPAATRYFFVAMACSYVLVAIVGVAPSYVAHFAGTVRIHPIAHVPGTLMTSWLMLFLIQTRSPCRARWPCIESLDSPRLGSPS